MNSFSWVSGTPAEDLCEPSHKTILASLLQIHSDFSRAPP